MLDVKLYEEIFTRKSIRKYEASPLPETVLAEIKDFALQAKPLFPELPYEFVFLNRDLVKSLLAIKAPHYICFYSQKDAAGRLNAGFLMQQLNLYLSLCGLGSCWLGAAKPNNEVPLKKGDKDFIIMMAFGQPAEPSRRTSAAEFKRAPLSAMTNLPEQQELLEPVRLAPSAMNSQPWFFSGTPDSLLLSRKKLSILEEPLMGPKNQVDLGIGLCHLVLSSEHLNKSAEISPADASSQNGYIGEAQILLK